jgi:hypothetical protein
LQARSSAPGNRSPAQITINREGLSVAVGHVQAGLAPLFGGTIDLTGSKVWIEHFVTLRGIENQPPEGAIEITSWARRIRGAQFVLQEGLPAVPVDMSSGRENVTLKVPLDGTYTELVLGAFTGNPREISVDPFIVPTASFERAAVDAETLTVERARRGSDTVVTIGRAAVRYSTAKISSRRTFVTFRSAGSATVERTTSKIGPSASQIVVRDPALERLFARGTDCRSEISNAPFVSSGTCSVTVGSADQNNAKLDVKTEDVRLVAFSHVFAPVASTTVAYAIDARGNQETFSGLMTPFVARVGKLRLGTLQDLVLKPTPLGGTIGQ